MSSSELSEWLAYFQINVIPDPYMPAAIISHTVASAMAGKNQRFQVADFLPKIPVVLSPEEAAEHIIKQLGAVRRG